MPTFKINKTATIICEWKKTRTAFKHTATLLVKNIQRDEVKICYLNRTWESFEFESVINKLLNKTNYLTKRKQENFLHRISGRAHEESKAELKTVGAVMALGDIFCDSKEAKNDWKKRMLKAGLDGKGLIMPDDWDKLDEDTKQARLDGAIAQLTN